MDPQVIDAFDEKFGSVTVAQDVVHSGGGGRGWGWGGPLLRRGRKCSGRLADIRNALTNCRLMIHTHIRDMLVFTVHTRFVPVRAPWGRRCTRAIGAPPQGPCWPKPEARGPGAGGRSAGTIQLQCSKDCRERPFLEDCLPPRSQKGGRVAGAGQEGLTPPPLRVLYEGRRRKHRRRKRHHQDGRGGSKDEGGGQCGRGRRTQSVSGG